MKLKGGGPFIPASNSRWAYSKASNNAQLKNIERLKGKGEGTSGGGEKMRKQVHWEKPTRLIK